jgi:glycosyltransferase involved in cell wall biosynthesis
MTAALPLPAGAMPQISFILPAYNEEALIERTIRAIQSSAAPLQRPFEIIVADDASTDRTAEIARSLGARVVTVNHRQIARTRTAGAAAAAGSNFFFVDGDTMVTAAALRAALRALDGGAVGGGAAVRFDGEVPLMARLLTRVFVEVFILTRMAAGCFLFCTRKAFEASGGFDERIFASEEIAMSLALKRQGRFVTLREPVITSGRKIRMHGTARLLWMMVSLGMRGPGAVQRREGLELWYDGRRDVL